MRNPRPRKLTADLSRPFQLQRQHAQPQFRIQRRCSNSSTTEAASGYRQSHPDDHPERRNRRLSRSIRPIYHQTDERIEAHILVAFLAYCLQVTLKQRLRALAPGLTSRSVLDKMAAIQMVDVHLPTTDGRTVILSRYTEPEPDQALLLQRLKISLPDQPPPRITSDGVPASQ